MLGVNVSWYHLTGLHRVTTPILNATMAKDLRTSTLVLSDGIDIVVIAIVTLLSR